MATHKLNVVPIEHLSNAFLLTKRDELYPCGKALFLVGAGCSISAGIPGGAAVASQLAEHLATLWKPGTEPPKDGDVALIWLKRRHKVQTLATTLGDAYGDLFAAISPDTQREFVRRMIDQGHNQLNWATSVSASSSNAATSTPCSPPTSIH